MSSTPSHAAEPGAPGPLAAALVWREGDDDRSYPVFAAVTARPDGLFLAGAFFLEVGEEAELEFRLAEGRVRARARVVEVVRGDEPGMVVAWIDVDAAVAAKIASAARGAS